MKNTDFVHGWITIESYKNLAWFIPFASVFQIRGKCRKMPWALMIWTNYTSSSWIFHELMTPEVNGKSLFLVDKTASHSNYTPIPSHEILVGSWLSYGLSTRLLFSSIIWAADHICYITQLTGCSYLVLQSRNVFAYLVLGVFLPRFTS